MITQEDIDAMEDGMGLVERLRDARPWVLCSYDATLDEAADRIEQIERELAAEKALADMLYDDTIDMHTWRKAYRKARGM